MKGNVIKATLILAACLLTIIIYTLPKTESTVKRAGTEDHPASGSGYFTELEKRQTANLSEEKKNGTGSMEKTDQGKKQRQSGLFRFYSFCLG